MPYYTNFDDLDIKNPQVTLHARANVVKIDNCIDCVCYINCREAPILCGDTRGLKLAPCNILMTDADGFSMLHNKFYFFCCNSSIRILYIDDEKFSNPISRRVNPKNYHCTTKFLSPESVYKNDPKILEQVVTAWATPHVCAKEEELFQYVKPENFIPLAVPGWTWPNRLFDGNKYYFEIDTAHVWNFTIVFKVWDNFRVEI